MAIGRTETLILRILGDTGDASRSLRNISNDLGSLQDRLQQAGQAGRFLAGVFGAMSAAGAGLIQTTSRIAMRNQVLALSLEVVGRNAGYSQDELSVLVDRVKALGITTQQATLGVTRMIQGQLDLAQATDLARTAQDLAVVAGENSSETYGRLMEAILSLQPRLLRQYGIVATQTQILGDLAESTDAAAKRNRFFQYVLEEGARVAGVYEEAMGVVGKQITSVPRLVEEAKNALGKHFLPIIGKGVEFLSNLLKWFESLPEGVQKFIAHVILGGTAASALVAALGAVLAVLPMVVGGVSAVSGVLSSVAGVIGGALLPILAALGGTLAGVLVLVMAWREDWGGFRSAVERAVEKVAPLVRELGALVKRWGSEIGAQLRKVWIAFRELVEPMFARLKVLIGSVDFMAMIRTLQDAVNVAGQYITAMLQSIENLLRGQGLRSFLPMKDAVIDALTLVALVFDKYISKALSWGYNLIVQAANGIIRAGQTVLVAAMRQVGRVMSLFLAPGSPPKKGPLSNIVRWGRGLINTFLKAFELADFGIMRDALSPIQDALESALMAGDIDEVEFSEIFGRAREQVAELIATFRETGEISEDMLSGIAETLGEGSDEYVELIRRQLEYQRAMEDLQAVQDEVSEARERGFVPAELKNRLEAAQAEADAAEEAVNWQSEYLAMQQESVDLQLRLAQALEGLTDAMESGGGAEDDGGGGGAVEVEPLDTGLDLGGFTDDVGTGMVELGEMSEEFEEMRGRVLALIDDFKAWLDLPLAEKVETIADYLTDVTGLDFSGFWEDVQDVIERIDEEGLFAVARDVIRDGIEWAWSSAVKEVDEKGVVSVVFNLITGGFYRAMFRVIRVLGGIWLQMFNRIWGPVISEAGVILDGLREDLRARVDSMRSSISSRFESIRAAAVNKVEQIRAGVVGKVEEIREGFLSKVDELRDGASAKVDEIKAAILERVRELFESMGLDLDEMAERWGAIWNDVQLIAAEIWDRIYTAVTKKVAEVRQSIEEKIDALRAWWSSIWTAIRITLALVWARIYSEVSRRVAKVRAVVEDKVSQLRTWWSTVWGAIWTTIKGIWEKIVSTVGNKAAEVYDAVKGAIDDVREWIGRQVGRFIQVGRDLLNGLKEGVLQVAGDLIEAVTGAVEEALARVKEILGIESPSKVFRGIAEFVMRGLAGGAEDYSHLPIRAMERVADSIRSVSFSPVLSGLQSMMRGVSLAGAGAGAGAGSPTIHMRFDGGLVFPNVRDGRDAAGVRRELQRTALEATMKGRVRGK